MNNLKAKIVNAGLDRDTSPVVGSSSGICGQCIVCTPGHIINT